MSYIHGASSPSGGRFDVNTLYLLLLRETQNYDFSLHEFRPDSRLLERFPKAMLEGCCAVPLFSLGEMLFVAVPEDSLSEDFFKYLEDIDSNCVVIPVRTSREFCLRALQGLPKT